MGGLSVLGLRKAVGAGRWDGLVAANLARCLVPTSHTLICNRGEMELWTCHRPWACTSSGCPGQSLLSLAQYVSERRCAGRFARYVEGKKKRRNVGRSSDTRDSQHLPALQAVVSPWAISFGRNKCGGCVQGCMGRREKVAAPCSFPGEHSERGMV